MSRSCSPEGELFGSGENRTFPSSFSRLADLIAARQVLLRCQSDAKYLNEQAGVHWQDEDDIFRILHEHLRRVFKYVASIAKLELEKLNPWREREKEVNMNLWLYKDRILHYQQLLISSNHSEALAHDTSIVVPIPNAVFDEHKVMLCTANVLLDLRSQSKREQAYGNKHPIKGTIEDYQLTVERLKVVFSELSRDIVLPASYKQNERAGQMLYRLRAGFPASHIAFWNYDTAAAIRLWKFSQRAGEQRDLFGRTFAHIVTEMGDVKTLDSIARSSERRATIQNTGLDDRGMSLLALTAMTGDWDTFTYLVKKGMHKCRESKAAGQSLLDLAIASGSKSIVERLLKEGIAFPLPSHIMVAMEKRREDIAICFVNELTIKNRLDAHQLANLAKLSHSNEMFKLENSIKTISASSDNFSGPVDDYYYTPHMDMAGFTSENFYGMDGVEFQPWFSQQTLEMSSPNVYNQCYGFTP